MFPKILVGLVLTSLWAVCSGAAKQRLFPDTPSVTHVRNDPTFRVKKEVAHGRDEWADARYAGIFAKMLQDLESENKPLFVEFISSAYTEEEIPRHLPAPLKVLSRLQVRNSPLLTANPSLPGTRRNTIPSFARANGVKHTIPFNSITRPLPLFPFGGS